MDPKQRIVIFAPGLDAGGGAEQTAVKTAEALGGPETSVILCTDRPVHEDWLARHFAVDGTNLQTAVLPSVPSWARCLPAALGNLLRDKRWYEYVQGLHPDVFLNMKYKSDLPGPAPYNLYYVHFPHRLGVQTRGVAHRAYLAATAMLRRMVLGRGGPDFLRTYHHVVANSRFTAGHVAQRWGRRAEVLPPPCQLVGGTGEGVVREKIIVSLGRFQVPGEGIPHKNQELLISAFSRCQDLIDEGWKLVLVGARGEDPGSRAFFAGLQERASGLPVEFVPQATRSEIDDIFRRARIYWHAQGYGTDPEAHPEAQEHFGISTVEAMSAGLVPLVYATAGPLEVVEALDPDLCWRTPEELVDSTRRIASGPPDERLRERARERAAVYSAEAYAARVRGIVAQASSR